MRLEVTSTVTAVALPSYARTSTSQQKPWSFFYGMYPHQRSPLLSNTFPRSFCNVSQKVLTGKET